MAALDVGRIEIAESCLPRLLTQFPGSNRVKRLGAMIKEAKGKYEEALIDYAEILKANPANFLAMKRKVAVYKALGDNKAAIIELHELIKVNAGDLSSWVELSELHLSLCDYTSAAFCVEEIILLNPVSAASHCRLAEIYYTMGGVTNLINARKHYSTSLSFQTVRSGNLRALYGLLLTCRSLECLKSSMSLEVVSEHATTNRALEENQPVTVELNKWSLEQLQMLNEQFSSVTSVSTNSILAQALTAFGAALP